MHKDELILDCLQLINTENIGPVTFAKLITKFSTPHEALNHLPDKYKNFPRSLAEREMELAFAKHIDIITCFDARYPENLQILEDKPPVLYISGNSKFLSSPLGISIVGARNASINGRKTASKIAYDLSSQNILVVSGMARGIDSAAHKGAMYAQSQTAPTIAVLGTGVDVIYPQENINLYHQIAEQGVIISEFSLGTQAQSSNFPRRNRIVSGLTMGTLVVEAGLHSGSLITAKTALDQGRDIFAIPGSPTDTRAQGPNKLIKDGAILVEDAQDIINTLSITNKQQIKSYTNKYKAKSDEDLFIKAIDKQVKTDNIHQQEYMAKNISVREYLTPSGVYVDEIIRSSGLDSATVSMQLLELEMDGIIERQPGNKVALIKK